MRVMHIRRLAAGLVSVALATGVMATTAGSVAAASYCSGHGCDGTNPATTYSSSYPYNRCDYGAYQLGPTGYVHDQNGNLVGSVIVRYGPQCGTVWARVTNSNHPGWQATGIYVVGVNGGVNRDYLGHNCPTLCIDNVGSNVASWGAQVYALDEMGYGQINIQAEGYFCHSDSTCLGSGRHIAVTNWYA